MQAFHNDPAVKAKYVNRLAAHRAAERLVQGQGWSGAKGCAVGCTLEKYDHTRYPVELGLPEWLARLEDVIFEGLPKGEAEQFAEDFLAVIPVGADVSDVRRQLAILRQQGNLKRLEGNTEPYAQRCREAIQQVSDWHANGEQESAARSAAWSAESAARSAARSAAWPAARSAARAARSAESAARSAARSAAWPSARSAARSAAWSAAAGYFEWEAKTLLELLAAC